MIHPGDAVRIRKGTSGFEGGPQATYTVRKVANGVADLYEGKPNREKFRSVPVEKLVKRRRPQVR